MANDNRIQRIITEHGGGFTPGEFLDNRHKLTLNIIRESVKFRNWHKFYTQITSAYRTTGSHRYGSSIDALLWAEWKRRQPDPRTIWIKLTTYPWHGVGMYFDWEDGLGIHYDLVPFSLRERPLRWIRVDGVYYYQRSSGLFYSDTGFTGLKEQIDRWKERQG